MANTIAAQVWSISCPACQAGPMLCSTANQHIKILLCLECGAALSMPRETAGRPRKAFDSEPSASAPDPSAALRSTSRKPISCHPELVPIVPKA